MLDHDKEQGGATARYSLGGLDEMVIDILHVSDLHMNARDRGRILTVTSALIKDIARLRDSHGVRPELVLFTGDVAGYGEDSYDSAVDDFILPVLNELGLDEDRLFVVPGNHDVDRSVVHRFTEEGLDRECADEDTFLAYWDCDDRQNNDVYLGKKFARFQAFSAVIKNKSLTFSDFRYSVYRLTVQGITVGILGLNSAWRSSGLRPDDGCLVLGHPILEQALARLGTCDLPIAMMHHPLDMLAPWDRKAAEIAMANSFRLLFTGHLHDSDPKHTDTLYGSLYISSAAPLMGNEHNNGYSIARLDLDQEKLTIFLRRYYQARKEYDQETAKCPGGVVTYPGFSCCNPALSQLMAIARAKRALVDTARHVPMLQPIDLGQPVTLEEVFVEPVIADTSSYRSTGEKRLTYQLQTIMALDSNLVLFGGREYGKTTLLQHAFHLVNAATSGPYQGRIAVLLKFSDIPKNNALAIMKLIARELNGACSPEEAEEHVEAGRLVVLVDDFDDPRDDSRESRRRTFLEFVRRYPQCRYVLTVSETLTESFRHRSLSLCTALNARDFYLRSLNTAKVRELLNKWNVKGAFDVDRVLEQIMRHFSSLRMPLTPTTVTLFLGVFFKRGMDADIQNEAYLIENYLESILERLGPDEARTQLDFREKESLLAALAYDMVVNDKFALTEWEFGQFVESYFSNLGENVPGGSALRPLFARGILREADGLVSFRLFWFNFFLAKMMQNNPAVEAETLQRPDYLRFARALAYKAGLDRRDLELLKVISSRATEQISRLAAQAMEVVDYSDLGSFLVDIGDEVEQRVRKGISSEERDEHSDRVNRVHEDTERQDGPDEIEEVVDAITVLVTLESEVIRNTTHITFTEKEAYLEDSMHHYLCLVWVVARAFQEFLSEQGPSGLAELASAQSGKQREPDRIVDEMRRLVFSIIPVSIALYMTEHLNNPKLVKCVHAVFDRYEDEAHKLFSVLLLFRLDPDGAVKELSKFVKDTTGWFSDSLIHVFLMIYCFEHSTSDELFASILQIMDMIRQKRNTKTEVPVFWKDTFLVDMRKRMLVERQSAAGDDRTVKSIGRVNR